MIHPIIPPAIAALPTRASELQAQLIRWANQNSGSDNFAGLDAMLALLHPAFATLPGTVGEVALRGTTARALRVTVRPEAPFQLLLSGHYDTVYSVDHPFQRCTPFDSLTLVGPAWPT